MDLITLVIIALVAINLIITIWVLSYWRRRKPGDAEGTVQAKLEAMKAELVSKQMEGLVSLRESLDSANRLMNERLAEGTQTLDRRMAVVGEIENKLGRLSAQTKNIEAIGKNIQSLSDILKPPKLRGTFGETLLENLLGEILPGPMFETQYKFADGGRVDAVVKVADRLLPIDSKFPLEAFQRLSAAETDDERSAARKELMTAIRKHVDDISGKYIKPDQGTTEVALMYIPSESVYYELVSNAELDGVEYALTRRVVASCPGHLYAFLASIAAVYAETSLTDNPRMLIEGLNSVAESLDKLKRYNERMSGSLRSATQVLEKSEGELSHMADRLEKMRRPQSE